MGPSWLYGPALLGASVQALAFSGPRPTNARDGLPQLGWSPKPTPGPDAGVVHALLRRLDGLPSSYLAAPDNTCGFIGGSSRAPYACPNDYQCIFMPSSVSVPGAVGCCNGDGCAFRLSCYDRQQQGRCDKGCQADSRVLKCTAGSAKFCNTIAFPDGVTDYLCGTKSNGVLKAQTASNGDNSRSMSTVDPTTSSTSTSSSSSDSSSSTSDSSSPSDSSLFSSDTSTTTSTSTDTAVAGAATASTTAATATASSTPVGAIVGGIIGAIAGIALIAVGAVFLRQHQKKRLEAAAALPPSYSMSQQTFPPAAPYGQQSAPSHTAFPPSSPHPASNSANQAHMYAAAGAFTDNRSNSNAISSHHGSAGAFPEPSPLSTPSGSPRPQYQHQPRAPPPISQPSYYNPLTQANEPWANMSDYADIPDRQSTSTPVSAYNGRTPVSPASALGSMPGEQHAAGMAGVPLILQPGMGYRPYRPAAASAVAAVRAVAPSPAPPEAQGLGIQGAAASTQQHQSGERQGGGSANELP